MAAWTEYVLAWTFLTDPNRFALALGFYWLAGS
jgi:ABC-type maltose transport system permease subunit